MTTLRGSWAEDEHLLALCERARKEGHDEVADRLAQEVIDREIDREWAVRADDGGGYDTHVTACTRADAVAAACDDYRYCDGYDTTTGPVHLHLEVSCYATGEEECGDVTIPMDEPECVGGRGHDWASPYDIVGGIKENPGVWGHGGGVICREVCLRCGCGRTTDTWAGDGCGGHTEEVTYESGQHLDALQERRDRMVRTALAGVDTIVVPDDDWSTVYADHGPDDDGGPEILDAVRAAVGGCCDVRWAYAAHRPGADTAPIEVDWRSGATARANEIGGGS